MTAHALAYRSVVTPSLQRRLHGPRIPLAASMRALGVGDITVDVDDEAVRVDPLAVTLLALGAVTGFCRSGDESLDASHVPHVPLPGAGRRAHLHPGPVAGLDRRGVVGARTSALEQVGQESGFLSHCHRRHSLSRPQSGLRSEALSSATMINAEPKGARSGEAAPAS